MHEQKRAIMNQLTNLIVCLMIAIPAVWLLQSYGLMGVLKEYFMFYYCALLSIGLMLTAIDKEKMVYFGATVLPLAVVVVFRDRELFFNSLAAFILFYISMKLITGKRKREILLLITFVLILLCAGKAEVPKVVAVSLTGLTVLAVSEFMTKHTRYALTLVVILECIVMLINVDTKPLLWKPLAKEVDNMITAASGVFNNVEYRFGFFDNVSYSGYSEPGGMFNGINYRYREELDVQVVGKIARIYLKGASYSGVTKDGITDKVMEDAADNGWFAIYLNSLYNCGITREEARSFSKLLKVNVKYEYMQTSDVMRSENLLSIDDEDFDGEKAKNHEYSFNYVALDYANPYLDAVIRSGGFESGFRINRGFGTAMAYDYFYRMNMTGNSELLRDGASARERNIKPAAYSVIKDYAYDIYNIDLENIIDEKAYEQAFVNYEKDSTDERYLEDSLVTDRIRDLTLEITEDAVTDYEKARNIESFLRQYSYDINVDLRDSDNYVESFLFETQSGYCAHYASAMVEMLRSIGIPARYTQGYRHVTKKGEAVFSKEAHAWPEAFIKGIGWVPFEPTVIYLSAPDTGWGLMPNENRKEEVEEKVEPYDPVVAVPPSDVETQKKKAGVTDQDNNEGLTDLGVKDTLLYLIRNLGKYVLGLVGVTVLLILIYKMIEVIRYNRLSPYDKVISDIGVISRKCDKRVSGNKVLSVFDYIPYIRQKKTDYDLDEVFGEYYRIRYRGDEPQNEYVVKLHQLAKNA